MSWNKMEKKSAASPHKKSVRGDCRQSAAKLDVSIPDTPPDMNKSSGAGAASRDKPPSECRNVRQPNDTAGARPKELQTRSSGEGSPAKKREAEGSFAGKIKRIVELRVPTESDEEIDEQFVVALLSVDRKGNVYLEKYHQMSCHVYIPSLTEDENGHLCVHNIDEEARNTWMQHVDITHIIKIAAETASFEGASQSRKPVPSSGLRVPDSRAAGETSKFYPSGDFGHSRGRRASRRAKSPVIQTLAKGEPDFKVKVFRKRKNHARFIQSQGHDQDKISCETEPSAGASSPKESVQPGQLLQGRSDDFLPRKMRNFDNNIDNNMNKSDVKCKSSAKCKEIMLSSSEEELTKKSNLAYKSNRTKVQLSKRLHHVLEVLRAEDGVLVDEPMDIKDKMKLCDRLQIPVENQTEKPQMLIDCDPRQSVSEKICRKVANTDSDINVLERKLGMENLKCDKLEMTCEKKIPGVEDTNSACGGTQQDMAATYGIVSYAEVVRNAIKPEKECTLSLPKPNDSNEIANSYSRPKRLNKTSTNMKKEEICRSEVPQELAEAVGDGPRCADKIRNSTLSGATSRNDETSLEHRRSTFKAEGSCRQRHDLSSSSSDSLSGKFANMQNQTTTAGHGTSWTSMYSIAGIRMKASDGVHDCPPDEVGEDILNDTDAYESMFEQDTESEEASESQGGSSSSWMEQYSLTMKLSSVNTAPNIRVENKITDMPGKLSSPLLIPEGTFHSDPGQSQEYQTTSDDDRNLHILTPCSQITDNRNYQVSIGGIGRSATASNRPVVINRNSSQSSISSTEIILSPSRFCPKDLQGTQVGSANDTNDTETGPNLQMNTENKEDAIALHTNDSEPWLTSSKDVINSQYSILANDDQFLFGFEDNSQLSEDEYICLSNLFQDFPSYDYSQKQTIAGILTQAGFSASEILRKLDSDLALPVKDKTISTDAPLSSDTKCKRSYRESSGSQFIASDVQPKLSTHSESGCGRRCGSEVSEYNASAASCEGLIAESSSAYTDTPSSISLDKIECCHLKAFKKQGMTPSATESVDVLASALKTTEANELSVEHRSFSDPIFPQASDSADGNTWKSLNEPEGTKKQEAKQPRSVAKESKANKTSGTDISLKGSCPVLGGKIQGNMLKPALHSSWNNPFNKLPVFSEGNETPAIPSDWLCKLAEAGICELFAHDVSAVTNTWKSQGMRKRKAKQPSGQDETDLTPTDWFCEFPDAGICALFIPEGERCLSPFHEDWDAELKEKQNILTGATVLKEHMQCGQITNDQYPLNNDPLFPFREDWDAECQRKEVTNQKNQNRKDPVGKSYFPVNHEDWDLEMQQSLAEEFNNKKVEVQNGGWSCTTDSPAKDKTSSDASLILNRALSSNQPTEDETASDSSLMLNRALSSNQLTKDETASDTSLMLNRALSSNQQIESYIAITLASTESGLTQEHITQEHITKEQAVAMKIIESMDTLRKTSSQVPLPRDAETATAEVNRTRSENLVENRGAASNHLNSSNYSAVNIANCNPLAAYNITETMSRAVSPTCNRTASDESLENCNCLAEASSVDPQLKKQDSIAMGATASNACMPIETQITYLAYGNRKKSYVQEIEDAVEQLRQLSEMNGTELTLKDMEATIEEKVREKWGQDLMAGKSRTVEVVEMDGKTLPIHIDMHTQKWARTAAIFLDEIENRRYSIVGDMVICESPKLHIRVSDIGEFGMFGVNYRSKKPLLVKKLESYIGEKFTLSSEMLPNCVRHKNVLSYMILEEDYHGRYFYVASELCEMNLAEYVHSLRDYDNASRRRLQTRTCMEIMSGLKYLHSLGVVHGRLKPTNVLIQYDNGAVLCDYGLLECRDTVMGYLAEGNFQSWRPQEFLEEYSLPSGLRADIQVAGMLLFYVWTLGDHPFRWGDKDIQDNILNGRKKVFVLDDGQSSLVMSMVTSSPAARPTAAQVLCDPVFWSYQRKFSFVMTVFLQLVLTNGPGSSNLCQRIDNVHLTLPTNQQGRSSWHSLIPTRLLCETSRLSHMHYHNSLTNLLYFIHDTTVFLPSMSPEYKSMVGKPPIFFTTHFPTLAECISVVLRDEERMLVNQCTQSGPMVIAPNFNAGSRIYS